LENHCFKGRFVRTFGLKPPENRTFSWDIGKIGETSAILMGMCSEIMGNHGKSWEQDPISMESHVFSGKQEQNNGI
jgi:hypothetical protein